MGGAPSLPSESDAVGGGQLTLTPPQPAIAVAPTAAEAQVPIDAEAAARIEDVVTTFVNGITGLDVHGEEYRRRIGDITSLAERDINTTSEMSNRLLDRPTRAMGGLGDSQGSVARSLIDLRRTVEDLNPAKYDLSRGGPRKLLGMIPFGDRIRAYFSRYQKSQSHIQGIVGALRDGAGELNRDNAAIAQEQKALWTQMETLRQYAYMAARLDAQLESGIADIEVRDAGRARVLREDVLFPIRRRHQEILTQLAVAIQGYAALRVVEANNRELVHAVQVATTTTVAALRTAVMVAQALTNQRLVSEQVKAVSDMTSTMIEGTSGMLRDQSAAVQEQAMSPGLDLATLQRAWDNVFAALDQIDTYKLRALEAMKVTVHELSGQIDKSRPQVERLHAKETDQRGTAPGSSAFLRLP